MNPSRDWCNRGVSINTLGPAKGLQAYLIGQFAGGIVGAMPANAEDDALSMQREPEIEKLAEGRWRCDAQLSVREWATLFRPVVEDHHQDALDDVSTLGGLVMVLADRLPAAGDAVTIGNLRLTVDAVEHRRVTRVLVEWSDRQSAPQRGEASR
mgnify:CR=1 FL=1